MMYRNRIGNTAVVVEVSVDIDRAAERRKRAGRHDGAVVVAHDVELGKIGCPSGEGIRCRHIKFSRIFHDGIVVNRVGTIRVGQRAVDILETEQISGAKQAADRKIARIVKMYGIETQISAALTGKVGERVGSSGRDADTIVECDRII